MSLPGFVRAVGVAAMLGSVLVVVKGVTRMVIGLALVALVGACGGQGDDTAGALADAVTAGDTRRAEALLEAPTLAVRAGQIDAVERLLERGADANARSSSGSTPLLEAVYHRAPPEIVRILLEAGADMEVRGGYDSDCSQAVSGPEGLTATEWAMQLGREEVLGLLLAQPTPQQ